MVIFCSLFVPRSLARHIQDAVGIDVESDLDLRHATRGRRNAAQLKTPSSYYRFAIARSPCKTWTSTTL